MYGNDYTEMEADFECDGTGTSKDRIGELSKEVANFSSALRSAGIVSYAGTSNDQIGGLSHLPRWTPAFRHLQDYATDTAAKKGAVAKAVDGMDQNQYATDMAAKQEDLDDMGMDTDAAAATESATDMAVQKVGIAEAGMDAQLHAWEESAMAQEELVAQQIAKVDELDAAIRLWMTQMGGTDDRVSSFPPHSATMAIIPLAILAWLGVLRVSELLTLVTARPGFFSLGMAPLLLELLLLTVGLTMQDGAVPSSGVTMGMALVGNLRRRSRWLFSIAFGLVDLSPLQSGTQVFRTLNLLLGQPLLEADGDYAISGSCSDALRLAWPGTGSANLAFGHDEASNLAPCMNLDVVMMGAALPFGAVVEVFSLTDEV